MRVRGTEPRRGRPRRALCWLAALLAAQAWTCGGNGGSSQQPIFVVPQNTGGLFANPANQYIAAGDLHFEPGRIVVVHGRAAIFPNTYEGTSIFVPANGPGAIELRYWSMCNNIEAVPYPVVQCAADYATNLDGDGSYTYVLSADESGADPPTPPPWVPADATWLPWGSTSEPNILILRNMLPSAGFDQTVQGAFAAGCTVDNQAGTPVPGPDLAAAGRCARKVMDAYYPVAAYCQQDLFIAQGWRGCFAAAGVS